MPANTDITFTAEPEESCYKSGQFKINSNDTIREFEFPEKEMFNVSGNVKIDGFSTLPQRSWLQFCKNGSDWSTEYNEIIVTPDTTGGALGKFTARLPKGTYTLYYYNADFQTTVGVFEITGDKTDLNIDLKKVSGKINLSECMDNVAQPNVYSENFDSDIEVFATQDTAKKTVEYYFYLQQSGKYYVDLFSYSSVSVEDTDKLEFNFNGSSMTVPDVSFTLAQAGIIGYDLFAYTFPLSSIDKLTVLSAPSGVKVIEKTLNYSERMNSAGKITILPKKISPKIVGPLENVIIKYYIVTGIKEGEKIKVEAQGNNPMLKTTIRELVKEAGSGTMMYLDFDLAKANSDLSSVKPAADASTAPVISMQGDSAYIPAEALPSLAQNNNNLGVSLSLNSGSILLSPNMLSSLAELNNHLGISLKANDNSFESAAPVLSKLKENTGDGKAYKSSSEKAFSLVIGDLKTLSDKTKITVKSSDTGLGDVDFSKVKALIYNEETQKFEELETSYNSGDNTISFETIKTGYIVFALKGAAVVNPSEPSKPEQKPAENAPTGDNILSYLAVITLFSASGTFILSRKKKSAVR